MGNLVSVIVPTYNGEKFIAQTLGAIINQDYENLEIIVVDDVSTDNTVEVAKKILESSGRKFQLIQRSVNGHQSAARNTGLDASNGDYVIFFDHDDLAEKNFVSSLFNEIENKNADLVFCGVKHFMKVQNQFGGNSVLPEENFSNPEYYLKLWSEDKITLCTVWNFIFRKSFLTANKLRFPEDCFIFEDIEFILKAVVLSSRISFVKDFLYIYGFHPAQQTKTDRENRTNYKNFRQEIIARWRAGRCILRRIKDEKIKNFVLVFYVAYPLIKLCTLYARAVGKYDDYIKSVRTLKHKKIRKIMFLTLKYITREPELFFKAMMILYFPNLYYKLRRKRK
ncbi:MAG: glycosyltransferase family 2 protein [Synergistaceae bacterium]|nr:glycosyltransferase family 2 protein [Synergistaceae bacterium]